MSRCGDPCGQHDYESLGLEISNSRLVFGGSVTLTAVWIGYDIGGLCAGPVGTSACALFMDWIEQAWPDDARKGIDETYFDCRPSWSSVLEP